MAYQGTCIIYLRKSTQWDDRQTVSIETQEKECEDLAKQHNLRVIDKIEEKKSAKTSGKRPWFLQLLKLCKKWGIDYVIASDTTRVSRNTMDAALFTELISEKKIKWLYAASTGQLFDGLNIFSAMMLGISFLMSKADNDMRASNVKTKMKTHYNNGRIITRMPFGYKSIPILSADGEKVSRYIKIMEKEAALVRMAFQMRIAGKNMREIAEYFTQEGYKKTAGIIDKLLRNEFYIGIQDTKFGRVEISMLENKGYKRLISVEDYEKVNDIKRIYKRERNVSFPAYFRGLVFDRDNIPLTPYQTENKYGVRYTYYRSQNYSKHQLNISEDKLIEKANEYMKRFENLPMNIIQGFGLQITHKVAEGRKQMNVEKQTISREIGECEKAIINLQDKYIANKIDDTMFADMLTRYNDKKRQLVLKNEKIDKQHQSFEDLSYSLVKLLENLSQTYKEGTLEDKSRILKSIQVKLFYDEIDLLYIKQNPMLEALDFGKNEIDFWDGSATENRTPVTGMRILGPNH
jgi:DNA invertase Pin-like site-specific DNA recombinase